MTAEVLLARLDSVRSRGAGRYTAKCPSHADKSPSLSVREGDRGLLVHCFGGCTVEEICTALALRVADLFHDAPDSRTGYRERVRRTQTRQRKAQHDEVVGFTLDALREADYYIRSRRGLDIAIWSHERLNDELGALADAHALLWAEELTQWI
jgi:DNA primase